MTGQCDRVLLVDDDPRNVRLLEGIFRADGYQVSKAYGGEEALRLATDDHPDLILLDVMMPHMSGHEVCSRLKADPQTRPIPVILVTALNALEDKVQGLDRGADDFVSKPVNRIELLAKARSLLRAKALHDELAAAKAELERKNTALERLEKFKESLTQMIVHDLKNPLTAIMGNLQLTIQSRPGDRRRRNERLERALASSRSMMRMILDLLDIGRMEENRLPLLPTVLDPAELLEECAAEVEGLMGGSGIALERELPRGPLMVRADRGIVARILANLLSNAIKHTPQGGTITMGLRGETDGVVLWVRDTGEGIPEEFQARIFEKFEQGQRRKLGTPVNQGLGLTFCRMAVEAHGGKISVTSRPGQGSTFSVFLPVSDDVPASEDTQTSDAAGTPELAGPAGHSRR